MAKVTINQFCAHPAFPFMIGVSWIMFICATKINPYLAQACGVLFAALCYGRGRACP